MAAKKRPPKRTEARGPVDPVVARREAFRAVREREAGASATPAPGALVLAGAEVEVIGRFERAIPEILGRLADGEMLTAILPRGEARPAHLPSISRFLEHVVLDSPPGLADAYRRARESWSHAQAEEAIAIADDSRGDTRIVIDRQGNEVLLPDHEWMARSRLRVEARLRLIGRFHPKQFGETKPGATPAAGDPKEVAVIPYPVVALPPLDAPSHPPGEPDAS